MNIFLLVFHCVSMAKTCSLAKQPNKFLIWIFSPFGFPLCKYAKNISSRKRHFKSEFWNPTQLVFTFSSVLLYAWKKQKILAFIYLFIYLFIYEISIISKNLLGELHPILIEYNLQLGDFSFPMQKSPPPPPKPKKKKKKIMFLQPSLLSFKSIPIAYVLQQP
jgi:hypothetical protein